MTEDQMPDPVRVDDLATDDVPEGVDPPTLDELATAGDASADCD